MFQSRLYRYCKELVVSLPGPTAQSLVHLHRIRLVRFLSVSLHPALHEDRHLLALQMETLAYIALLFGEDMTKVEKPEEGG
jgi:hypothetical protein